MQQALLIILGAVIAFASSLAMDTIRDRREQRRNLVERRREMVELYLPKVLNLLVAARWLHEQVRGQVGERQYDNPYPSPGEDIRVATYWYPEMLHLGHHPQMPGDVRETAQAIVEDFERWNATVDTPSIGIHVAESIIQSAEDLVGALERIA